MVQLYIADPESSVQKPPKELESFTKVSVELPIDARSLQHYDPQLKGWCVEPGVFEVLVGTSSADVPLSASFTACGPNLYAYGPRTTIGKLFADPRARDVLAKHLPARSMSPAMTHLMLQFMPDMPLGRMLERWTTAASGIEPERIEQLKNGLYAELAAMEV